eukprot:g2219.t1
MEKRRKKHRIAHPGGKITHNKEEATRKYLLRAALSPIQRRALRGVRIADTATLRSASASRRQKDKEKDKHMKNNLLNMTRQWLSRCSFVKTLTALDEELKRASPSSRLPMEDSSLIKPISMIHQWLIRTGFRGTANALLADLKREHADLVRNTVPRFDLATFVSGATMTDTMDIHAGESDGAMAEEEEEARLRKIHSALHEKNSARAAKRGEFDVRIVDDDGVGGGPATLFASSIFDEEAEEVADGEEEEEEEMEPHSDVDDSRSSCNTCYSGIFRYDRHKLLDVRLISEENGKWKKASVYTPLLNPSTKKNRERLPIVLDFQGTEIEGLGGDYYMGKDGRLFDGDGDEIFTKPLPP